MFIPGITFYELPSGKWRYSMYGLFGGGSSGICDDPEKMIPRFLDLYRGVTKTTGRTCNLRPLCEKFGLRHSYIAEMID